jgi:methionyl-tRNA synthetase
MKIVYEHPKEPVRACLLALQYSGIEAKLEVRPVPLVTLEIGDIDRCGNLIELMGELSITRYLMKQCSWKVPDTLNLDEWVFYHLRPIVLATPKSNLKSTPALLNEISFLESQITTKYLGGDNPGSADVLAFTYLYQYFSGNPWTLKTFPRLAESYKEISQINLKVSELLGEKVKIPLKTGKEVEEFAPHCTIKRDKSLKTLPQEGKRNILITSALPYVNNVPHLGNIIGCVLSADVYARFCRLRGYNTIYVCGTDEYGTATETKAIQEGLSPQQICDKYNKVHQEIYEWFDIDFDIFGRTTTQQQTEIASDIFQKLRNNGELLEDDVEQSFCVKCSRFLADRFVLGTCPHCSYNDARGDQCDKCGNLLNPVELINPKCFLCNSTPEVRTSRHIFINLPNIKDRLEAWVNKSSADGNWSSNCVKATNAWIRDGLKPRCITRDLKWGTPVPLPEYSEKVFYVWFDAPIGYISITANYTSEWEKWWKNPDNVELIQFMGKDNIPFHTVIFPCSLIGANDNWTLLKNISSTEYLNYEDGKFSKSRGTGVFGDNAAETGIPVEIFRYYLLSNRPESSDTVFKWTDLAEKNNGELLPNLGNLFNRLLKFLNKRGKPFEPASVLEEIDRSTLEKAFSQVQKYLQEMEEIKLKSALKTAMDTSMIVNKYLQDAEFWGLEKKNPSRFSTTITVAINLLRLVALLIEPFMPSLSAKVYSQMGLTRTIREERLLEALGNSSDFSVILTLVDAGMVVSNPLPIFKQISNEQVNSLKARYAGKNN